MKMGVAYCNKAFKTLKKTRFHFHSKNIGLKQFLLTFIAKILEYKIGLKLKFNFTCIIMFPLLAYSCIFSMTSFAYY